MRGARIARRVRGLGCGVGTALWVMAGDVPIWMEGRRVTAGQSGGGDIIMAGTATPRIDAEARAQPQVPHERPVASGAGESVMRRTGISGTLYLVYGPGHVALIS